MVLKYEKMVMGELQTNCYLVWEEESREAVVIDPADGGEDISDEIQRLKLKPLVILGTHGHFDHLLAVLDLKLIFNLPVGISSQDWFLLKRQKETAEYFLKRKIKTPNLEKVEIDLNRAMTIRLGGQKLILIKTPGHTPGGICFYAKENGLLFTGDTLFGDGSSGEISHKYSSVWELKNSLNKIFALPEDTLILPGHGEETKLGEIKSGL